MNFTTYEPWKIAEFMVETKTKPTSWIQIFRFASNIQQSNIQLRIFFIPQIFFAPVNNWWNVNFIAVFPYFHPLLWYFNLIGWGPLQEATLIRTKTVRKHEVF